MQNLCFMDILNGIVNDPLEEKSFSGSDVYSADLTYSTVSSYAKT